MKNNDLTVAVIGANGLKFIFTYIVGHCILGEVKPSLVDSIGYTFIFIGILMQLYSKIEQ